MQSMDDTLMTAELLCCLPAAPACPSKYAFLSVTTPVDPLSLAKTTHCLLQTEVVLQKHDNLLFHLMQQTKIQQFISRL